MCRRAHTHQNAQRNKRHTDFLRAVRATGYGLGYKKLQAEEDPAVPGVTQLYLGPI